MLAGQSLVKRDLRQAGAAQFAELAGLIRQADIAFTNLEGVVAGAPGGFPTKPSFIHASPPEALAGLRAMGFNLLSLANNHAYDLGTAGILHSLKVAESMGFATAGTGADLAIAGRAAMVDTSSGRCALVAMDASNLPDLAYAADATARLDARPGINPLRIRRTVRLPPELLAELARITESIGGAERSRRRLVKGYPEDQFADRLNFYDAWIKAGEPAAEDFEPVTEDLERNVAAIESAAREADCVIAYLHQHHWAPDWQSTPSWLRRVGRTCIEAGAKIFVSHGVPLPMGIEFHQGCPLFMGLGNFVFDTYRPERYPETLVWQSALAECRLTDAGVEVKAHPVSIDFDHHSRPRLASMAEAGQFIGELQRLSPGVEFRPVDPVAIGADSRANCPHPKEPISWVCRAGKASRTATR